MYSSHLRSLAIAILMTLALSTSPKAQNLVPNPDMEGYACCPTGTFQYNCIATWTNPNTASPEYFNACGSGGGDVPANSAGNELAHSGNGYVGLIIGWSSSNYREYCQVQLTSALVAGQTYSISYWVSLADGSQYSTDRFEAYLSPSLISNGTTNVLPFTPQIQPVVGFLANKAGWAQVCGTFNAAGGERYLIIGNFKNTGSTALSFVSAGLPFCQSGGYYYVDDVAVVTGTGGCLILPVTLNHFDADVVREGLVHVEWNAGAEDAVEKYILERSTITEAYKPIAEMYPRNGSQSNTYSFDDVATLSGLVYYRLKTIDHNGEAAYSAAIPVEIDGAMEEEGLKNLFPCPAHEGDDIQLDYMMINPGQLDIKIVDQSGRLVVHQSADLDTGINRVTLQTKDLAPGTYFMATHSKGATSNKKLVVSN